MHSVFGGIGLLAFALWLKYGEPTPVELDGGEEDPSPRGPVAQVLTNKYVWCSAGILYVMICLSSVFTFAFVALSGSFETAAWSKFIVFSLPFYLSVLFNGVVVVLGGLIGVKLSAEPSMVRPLIALPCIFAAIAGLALFSLSFSGIFIGLILELVTLIMFLVMLMVPAWATRVQELPGIGYDVIFNAIGAMLMISGIPAVIAAISVGWGFDQGWVTFKSLMYFFVLTWLFCGLGSLLIPRPAEGE